MNNISKEKEDFIYYSLYNSTWCSEFYSPSRSFRYLMEYSLEINLKKSLINSLETILERTLWLSFGNSLRNSNIIGPKERYEQYI